MQCGDVITALSGIASWTGELFNSLREEVVSSAHGVFASLGRKKQTRKSSMLRAMNRRISDTEMLYAAEEAVKRFSLSVLKE